MKMNKLIKQRAKDLFYKKASLFLGCGVCKEMHRRYEKLKGVRFKHSSTVNYSKVCDICPVQIFVEEFG